MIVIVSTLLKNSHFLEAGTYIEFPKDGNRKKTIVNMAAIHCPEGCFLPFVERQGGELLASARLLKICVKRERQVCLCFHISFCSHKVLPFSERHSLPCF